MKNLVRGNNFEEIISQVYLDDEADEMSNLEALKMVIYSQEDWEFRIRFFEPLRAKALLDNLAEKRIYIGKKGPIAHRDQRDNDNDYFFTKSGRFVFPRTARVLKRIINVFSDDAVYIVSTIDGNKTIVLPQ